MGWIIHARACQLPGWRGTPYEETCGKVRAVAFVSVFPLTLKRREVQASRSQTSPAARDPSLRSVTRDSVARVPCISLWALAEACGTDTLSSTGSCESS